MALTASEEALVRQLLDQQAAILSLAGNEATITSKLGATKVTLADLVAASSLADADLLLTRQGTNDKSVRSDILAAYMGTKLGALFAPIANPTFTGNPTAPTPAQFDNDTSLATTEFVQRALGNARGFVSFTSNAALTAAHAGMEIYASTSGSAITLTLPAANALPAGAKFRIYNTGVNNVIVSRVNADTIVVNNTTNTVTSVTLRAGDSIVLTSLGTGNLWYHGGGTAQSGNAGAFGSSLAGNGWQRLPSGLIIQWGTAVSSSSADVVVTYPIAFPTAARSVTAILVNGAGSQPVFASIGANSGTSFAFGLWESSTPARVVGQIFWTAVGH